jgi:AraC-like DNA-binding protein
MDPDRLCGFFNRLQVLLDLPLESALAQACQAIRALELTDQGAPFVVVRGGIATLALRVGELSPVGRYALLKAVLNAGTSSELTDTIEAYVAGTERPSDPRVVRVLLEIPVIIGDRKSCRLTYLAGLAGVSGCYLSRLVRQHTGRCLSDHIGQARIEAATALLIANPRGRLREIARAVGYKDGSEMCHHFKRATGYSPKKYIERSGRPIQSRPQSAGPT